MKITIPLILSYRDDQVIVDQPQFKYKHLFPRTKSLIEIKTLCENEIQTALLHSLRNQEKLPKIISRELFLKDSKLDQEFGSSVWIDVVMELDEQASKFPVFLKWVGKIINFVALAANSISALLSIELASEKTSETVQWTLGGISAFLNLCMLMIIYNYSGASSMLQNIGKNVQQMRKKPSRYEMFFEEIEAKHENCCSLSYKKIAVTTAALAGAGALQVIMCVNTYQDVYSKGLRLNYSHDSLGYKLILLLAWISTISLGLNNIAFQGSFVKAFTDDVTTRNKGSGSLFFTKSHSSSVSSEQDVHPDKNNETATLLHHNKDFQ